MKPEELNTEELWAADKNEYGSDYNSHLFEQYKILVESSQKVTDRRASANRFFLTANTAIVSFMGFSFSIIKDYFEYPMILFSITGILLCIFWINTIITYRQLNTGKFSVIHQLEARLPAKLFCYEWKILGEGKEQKKYHKLTNVEQVIPKMFMALYIVLMAVLLVRLVGAYSESL
jgi:hypothetical protein